MSGLIGINVDLGETMANTLGTQSDATQEQLNSLQQRVDSLLGTWQGNSRTAFEGEWGPLVREISDLIAQMHDMRDRLRRTIEGFRSADTF